MADTVNTSQSDSPRESRPLDEIADNCPFCGSDLPPEWRTAEMLHEAHEAIEKLAGAEPGSQEFNDLLEEVGRFVGA